jgi:hypothetical protein
MPKRRPSRPAAVPQSPVPAHPPVSRAEWLALAAIFLVAAALRFAFPGRMAVEHFDEGVYASNIFFGPEGGNRYPYRHLYAPPLLPWLIEWGVVFLGPESIAPFLPALILGTATVPLAWWSVRRWFGPAAGLAAALLVAASDFHVLYSRTALTDAPVAFFLLLAVYLYWESVRRGSLAWSAVAGLATALAWWTKYTGWLSLAVAAAGSAAWVLFGGRAGGVSLRSRAKAVAACFAVTAVTALAAFSPVLRNLQPYGGYAAVAENHRGYLHPIGDWWKTARDQIGNVAAQSGALTAIGMAAFVAFATFRTGRGRTAGLVLGLLAGVVLAAEVLHLGPVLPLALLAVAGLLIEYLSASASPGADDGQEPPPTASDTGHRRLAVWLVAAWLAGMTLTVPLYYGYARLMLPWLVPSWLATATWAESRRPPTAHPIRFLSLGGLLTALVLVAAVAAEAVNAGLSAKDKWFTAGASVPGWQDRTGIADASALLADACRDDLPTPDAPAVVYVLGEPAAFFHFAARLDSEHVAVLPAGDLSFADHPPPGVAVYLVIGPHGRPSVGSRESRNRLAARTARIAEVEYPPSNLTRLDRESRPRPGQPPPAGSYMLSLYRIHGPRP